MFKPIEIMKRFVHHFKTTGNLFKLVTIFGTELETLKNTIDKTLEWRAIENAEGTTLDEIGYNLNQPRGKATDEVYRVLLQMKIARNMSDGTVNKMIEVLSIALSIPPSDVRIIEQWGDVNTPQPATIKLDKIPYGVLVSSGIDANNFYKVVKSTTACGVGLVPIEASGTFEFGGIGTTPSAEHGFSSINNPNIGGYFGGVFTSNGDDLPI